ncbi:AAC(3)-I family aminoglycoside N-acetyltransferase [Pelagerythrobacter marensis]|uniref:Gentamicin 3'-N-acetyltransferase n=1 Tax=Pelagerythrobacter marensis TaxID=543877 RepID=A0A0G3XA49_9SPHN|nr:AAC(3)-I family aminoglycoside N-acetyltransferase [Pelagerythrobacter marensis]AKM08032.1 Gentamicin 3'-N-acetyltransferase [Pelagerythrobacter marensis]
MDRAFGVVRLGPGDLRRFRRLNDLFGEVFDDRESYCRQPPDDAYAARLLARKDTILLAAEADGAMVGALAGYVLPKFEQARSEIYIYDLAVVSAWRRRGVATGLIDEVRRIARAVGSWVVYVQADIGEEDAAAIALYDRIGTREEVLHFDIAP